MHLVEIGCRETPSLIHMLTKSSRLDIFEANPKHVAELRLQFRDRPEVCIHEVALWNKPCKLQLHDAGDLSYIEGIQSPGLVCFGYCPCPENMIEVDARTFDEFDDGTIDILDLDIEGCEWYVLEKMKSRPKFIIIETIWKSYTNPFLEQIKAWMAENHYSVFEHRDANTFYKLQA